MVSDDSVFVLLLLIGMISLKEISLLAIESACEKHFDSAEDL